MSTLASPAIYQNGIVIPQIKPPSHPSQVVVVYIDQKEQTAQPSKTANTGAVLAALEKIRGILSADIDGVEYENQIRQEAEEHLKRLEEKE